MDWTWLKQHWRDGVEIVLLAVVIYYAYNFLRRTRGAPIVNGLLILALLAFLATVLQFEVLSRLLGAVFGVAAIASVVIFQPELRRLLAELGTQSFFTTAREQRENIEVIIQTVERLADVRIGALVAIEQSVDVQTAVESSIVVDCEATPEMLETIFFPNNAIHDGGVIIKGNRILRAACIFPLTQRTDLSKSLGTRHRAAIGLSEETDALVVVVSEETGQISYAHHGQLVKPITVQALRAFLTAQLVSAARPPTWIDWLQKTFRNYTRNNALTQAAPETPKSGVTTPPPNGSAPPVAAAKAAAKS